MTLMLVAKLLPGPVGEDYAEELRSDFAEQADRRGTTLATLHLMRQVFSPNTFRLRAAIRAREQRSRPLPKMIGNYDGWLQDARSALRAIQHAPAYAATVIFTFALAAGANVAVFSVVNSVLLRPLPYANPDKLTTVNRVLEDSTVLIGGISYPDYADWRQETSTLIDMAAYRRARESYFGEDFAEEWFGLEVTPSLFSVLGVAPALGRYLQDNIDPEVQGDAIVLSHELWETRFLGDTNIVGQTLRFEDRRLTVVGVMPRGFYFPTRAERYWTTLGNISWLNMRGASGLTTIGRLSDESSAHDAQREFSLLAARTDALPEAMTEAAGVRIISYHETYVGKTKKLFLFLGASVTLVLLVACANIASLGMARATIRHRDFAIRSAVGAAPSRIVRMLLVENLLLASMGAAAGVAVAFGVVTVLSNVLPSALPRSQGISVDGTVLVFAIGVAVVSGLLFGIAPAMRAAMHARQAGLRNRTAGVAGDQHRTIRWLVVFQVGISQVLLVVAVLLTHSFVRLANVPPGFDTDHTLTMRLALPRANYPTRERVAAFHDALLTRIEAHPGVRSAGLTSALPFSPSDRRIAYRLADGDQETRFPGHMEVVSHHYMSTLDIPVQVGRNFEEGDPTDVILVSDEMARLHWPGADPIGKRVVLPSSNELRSTVTIIGVVGSVRKRGLSGETTPVVYLSLEAQEDDAPQYVTGRMVYLAVRTDGEPMRLANTVPEEILSLDKNVVVTAVQTSGDLVAESIASPRIRTLLIASFAGIALLVALVGIYGVMAFIVSQRTSEIGVRLALGAGTTAVQREVLGWGLSLVVGGVISGTAIAMGMTRLIASILFSVSPLDPTTFTAVPIMLSVIGGLACYLPARRASRVDPLKAVAGDY